MCCNSRIAQQGNRFITADIARLGGDKIVIIEWNGWHGKIKHYTKKTLDVTSTYIQAAMSRNQTGQSNTLLDSDGLGGGPVDFLKVKGFVNNARALPAPERITRDEPENFDNLKSQCYFRLAERINKNGLYLECETDEVRAWIIEELEQVKQKTLDSDMKKGVIPNLPSTQLHFLPLSKAIFFPIFSKFLYTQFSKSIGEILVLSSFGLQGSSRFKRGILN